MLVVSFAEGSARTLVKHLEEAKRSGLKTADEMRSVFGLDALPLAAKYMTAVLEEKGPAEEDTILQLWRQDLRTKQEQIQALLNHIYVTEVQGMKREASFLNIVDESQRTWIAQQISYRAKASKFETSLFWEDAIASWDTATSGRVSQVEFDRATNQFRRFINAQVPTAQQIAKWEQAPAKKVRTTQRAGWAEGRIDFLSYEWVRKIWNSGSFLTQEYGLTFNARIRIRWRRGGIEDPAEMTTILGDMLRGLQAHLKRRDVVFANVYLHERREGHGIVTTVVLHIPANMLQHADAWVRGFFEKRLPEPATSGFLYVAIANAGLDEGALLRRQRWLLRLLIGCADPGFLVTAQSGARISLLDALLVPKRHRRPLGNPGFAQPVSVSRKITDGAQKVAKTEMMSPLSIFDDGAWDWADIDWEMKEHQDRRAERARRSLQPLRSSMKGLKGAATVKDSRVRSRSWAIWTAPITRKQAK